MFYSTLCLLFDCLLHYVPVHEKIDLWLKTLPLLMSLIQSGLDNLHNKSCAMLWRICTHLCPFQLKIMWGKAALKNLGNTPLLANSPALFCPNVLVCFSREFCPWQQQRCHTRGGWCKHCVNPPRRILKTRIANWSHSRFLSFCFFLLVS